MKTYDAILVLGRGIYKDGSIPESAKATIRTAVDLWRQGVAPIIIFSGKWSYAIDYVPPTTEAAAMAGYGRTFGLDAAAIVLEQESYTTISNVLLIKRRILEPRGWRRVLLISLHPLDRRAFFNLQKVLGPTYDCDVVPADFSFPPDRAAALLASEKIKMRFAHEDLDRFQDGDDEAILKNSNMLLALMVFLDRTTHISRALIGSLNLRLQGIDLSAHDVDFVSDDHGVEATATEFGVDVVSDRGFKECTISLFDAEVSVVSCQGNDLRPCDFASHTVAISVNGRDVPCMSLESERQFYLAAGRDKDKAKVSLIDQRLASK